MTLEQKINTLINKFDEYGKKKIEEWIWFGSEPDSLGSMHYKSPQLRTLKLKVDMLIWEADEQHCLNSRSKYIRRCKRWMRGKDLKEEWSKKYIEINI